MRSVQRVRVGEGDAAPVVVLASLPPGETITAHTHGCDYVEIVMDGSEVVGREERLPGHVTVVPAGTTYGPLVAGDHGVVKLVVFRDGNAEMQPPIPVRNA